ncbi:MAG: ATP synthase F1 subunit delta [Acidimicrobiales bacterium]
MSERTDGYASAMLEIARAEGSLERVADELFSFARTLETSDELRATITDAAIPTERRQGVIEDLLGSRAHPVSVNLVSFVVGSGRGSDLVAIIGRLVELSAEARDRVVAEVRSAQPLSSDQLDRLGAALSQRTGKKVDVKVIIDPGVLGGLVTQIGDTVIDGSVRSRLAKLKEVL